MEWSRLLCLRNCCNILWKRFLKQSCVRLQVNCENYSRFSDLRFNESAKCFNLFLRQLLWSLLSCLSTRTNVCSFHHHHHHYHPKYHHYHHNHTSHPNLHRHNQLHKNCHSIFSHCPHHSLLNFQCNARNNTKYMVGIINSKKKINFNNNCVDYYFALGKNRVLPLLTNSQLDC